MRWLWGVRGGDKGARGEVDSGASYLHAQQQDKHHLKARGKQEGLRMLLPLFVRHETLLS